MNEISPAYVALLIGMILANCIAWLAEAEYRDRTFMKLFWKWWGFRSAEKYVVALFLMLNLVWGATKTNENDSVIGPPGEEQYMEGGGVLLDGGASMMAGETTRLTTNQCAAGLALVSVTNDVSWLTVPSNAVVYAPWTCYGAATDTFWLPATNWGFILGSNAVEGVHVASDGMLAFGWPKGSPRAAGMPDGTPVSFLAPLQGSLNIVPPEGRFWYAPTDSNSVLFTWQDAFAGRDTNSPVTFQAELFWNGDFTYRYAFPSNSLASLYASAFTNFVIGAQNNYGGETYALSDTNLLVNGLELHWRAIGVLDPGVDDHDGDGVSTYDEVMTWGTDPRLTDSDFDGLSDTVELAELSITTATNPDSDGDGLADGTDAEPGTWNNADADADQDGFPLWQELFYGTSDAVPGDVPPALPDARTVTFTFSGTLPPSAVLTIGGYPLTLAGRQQFDLLLAPDTVRGLALRNAPGVSASVTSAESLALGERTGGLAANGHGPGTASLAVVAVRLGDGDRLCLHAGETNLSALATAGLPGSYAWNLNYNPLPDNGASIGQAGLLSGRLAVFFQPLNGNDQWCSSSVSFSRCKRGGFCEHGLPWGECGACLHDDFWCDAHASPKPLCPCLTVSGGTQGALPPGAGLTRSFRVGDEEDTNAPWETPCCACLEHVTLGMPDTKTNIVREVSQKLRLWRNADRTGEVTVGTRLEGPTVLYVSAEGLSVTFGDACAYFSHELHPETQHRKAVEFTVAAVGLGPDSLSAAGRYLIRGGGVCTARVSVVTDSDLTAGSVGLTAGGGLFFSETPGAPAASALRGQTNGPPDTVAAARDFYLGATNGGLHTLTYELLDPSGSVYISTNLAVEAVVAKLATNAYYVAYGSTALLGVDLDPVSHDPAGFALYLDSSLCATGQPPWQVDTSSVTGGVHTLMVRSATFTDLVDTATLYVIKVELNTSKSGALCLMDTNQLAVTANPMWETSVSNRIEICEKGNSNWVALCEADSFTWVTRIAGAFKLRGLSLLDGTLYYSQEKEIEVCFPSITSITNDSVVYGVMASAWSNTLSCASPTGMCEIGFQILLNTTNGTYECEPVIYGDVMPSTNALGTITSVVLPNVSEVSPNLTALGMVYWVARFHTHTTTEYWTPPPPPAQIVRDVGPSPTDLNHVNGIPSVVFDYIESPESYQPQTIFNGWPKSSPAKLYTYGPTRRATP